MQYKYDEIGVKVSRAELVALLNDQRRGGFAYVHGYTSVDTGEVANHWFKGACHYGNMVARSVAMIEDGSLRDMLVAKGLKVKRGVWVDGAGIQHTRKAKDRVYQRISKTYSMAEEADRTKVMEAIASVLDGLLHPKTVDQGFDNVAKGTYEKDSILYFRDCMAVSKFVVKQGEQKQTASDEMPAMKEAIRKLLPVGKYRAYKLDGRFEYITIDGQALLQGADVSDWDMAVALKQDVKDHVLCPVANEIVDKIMEAGEAQ